MRFPDEHQSVYLKRMKKKDNISMMKIIDPNGMETPEKREK